MTHSGPAPVFNSAPGGFSATAADLARLLSADLKGDPAAPIRGVAGLDRANPGDLSFIRSPTFAALWPASEATVALITRNVASTLEPGPGRALVIVDDADRAMLTILTALRPKDAPAPPGAHPTAVIDPSATIHPSAHVGPHCVVGAGSTIGPGATLRAGVTLGQGVRIGANTTLHPRVVVADRCTIGDRCTLFPGVVVGADGFGYVPDPASRAVIKVPHVGHVEIGDDVDIGANSCIDRGKFGATTIGAGTKIDNLVQIAHNVRIGRNCLIAGCAGIAGSATIGDGVLIGGNAGVSDGLTVGAGAQIGALSGVMTDVPEGAVYAGAPATVARQHHREVITLRRLANEKRPNRRPS
jgi:UDP-3-O-[3-hydroxymyristoyl] glucosamine N-acyltransferase